MKRAEATRNRHKSPIMLRSILRNDFDLHGVKNGERACWGLILALTLLAMVALLVVRFTRANCYTINY
jgi:hypothetical protein